MTKEFFTLLGIKATIYLIAAFVATIVVVNIIAIMFCPLREMYERSKTPEEREGEREAEKKRREQEKINRSQINAAVVILTEGAISLPNSQEKNDKENEIVDEDFRAERCIWLANIGIIIIFGSIIFFIIGTIIAIALLTIIIPILAVIFSKVFILMLTMMTK